MQFNVIVLEEEVVGPAKRKPLSAELPRTKVIYELPGHEQICACGCRKYVICEETSEQLDFVLVPGTATRCLHNLGVA